MAQVDTYAAYAWLTYTPRTLVSGTGAAPTTRPTVYATAIWTYPTRTFSVPPGAITDLVAVAVSSTQVDLTWTAATAAVTHRIERATSS